jgi:heme exporter protein CcmD
MEFLLFDKYTTYIWASYLLAFATVAILFISTKATHKRTITQLRFLRIMPQAIIQKPSQYNKNY